MHAGTCFGARIKMAVEVEEKWIQNNFIRLLLKEDNTA
jgi:hypothetical protein